MSRILVFCFSHAGGISFAYRVFITAGQTGGFEYIPIDTSGHGKRMGEQLYFRFDEIVEDLYNKVCVKLGDRQQFMLMGHSMGAWIAFEITKRFQSRGISPELLILSSNVPAKYYNDRVSIKAGDEVVKAQLTERNPDLKQFFEDKMLSETFYPIIKADYIAIDGYLNKEDEGMKVSCNVLGIISDDDRFDEATMSKWKAYVDGVYLQKVIKGDHFAFYKEPEYVRQLIQNGICQ